MVRKQDGFTALMYAALNGHSECIGLLLRFKPYEQVRFPFGPLLTHLPSDSEVLKLSAMPWGRSTYLCSPIISVLQSSQIHIFYDTDGP